MILNLILLLAIPAAFVLGALAAVEIMCRIDAGVTLDSDDRGFEDVWRDEIAETPFSAGDETDIAQALALVRPKPYPPLRSVPE